MYGDPAGGEEDRVLHRRVVELLAAVVPVLPLHIEGASGGVLARRTLVDLYRTAYGVSVFHEPGLIVGKIDARLRGRGARGARHQPRGVTGRCRATRSCRRGNRGGGIVGDRPG